MSAVLDLETLTIRGCELTRTGVLPLPAARQVLAEHALSDADTAELIAIGLAKKISDALTRMRRDPTGESPERNPIEGAAADVEAAGARRKELIERVGRKVTRTIARHVVVLTNISLNCDGRLKSLRDFTRGDLQMWADNASNHSAAWRRRTTWFTSALKLVEQHGKERVLDLPEATLKSLATAAEQAWGNA